jgi:hypothetical protein
MKKQMIKGLTMFMLIVALAFVTAVVSANGQSQSVKADIPFEFAVGDKTLGLGEYAIKSATAGGDAMMIRSENAKSSALRLTNAIEDKRNVGQVKLVFHRYGERYFLAEVWAGESGGRELLKSRQERAIERELASIPAKGSSAQARYERVEVLATLQ